MGASEQTKRSGAAGAAMPAPAYGALPISGAASSRGRVSFLRTFDQRVWSPATRGVPGVTEGFGQHLGELLMIGGHRRAQGVAGREGRCGRQVTQLGQSHEQLWLVH